MEQFDYIEQKILSKDSEKLGQNNNFKLWIDGCSYSAVGGQTALASNPNLKIELSGKTFDENNAIITYNVYDEGINLEVRERFEFFNTCDSVRQTVIVKNTGTEAVTLSRVSSAVISGLGTDGVLKWYNKERFILYYCEMAWEGEAQWKHNGLKELGLYPNTVHANMRTIKFQSKGSWSTARYYPLIILEDKETGRSFYLEAEPSGSWEIDIYNLSKKFATDGCIAIDANCANVDNDGWLKPLQPGEEYCSAPCIYGSCNGNFEEAIHEITRYKRETDIALKKNKVNPVAYNCYMNSIWSQPRTETLIPLIDAASKLGIEIFCIDAGWFRCSDDKTKNAIGDYNIADDRFPGYGLKGILEYIKSKNMIPGIWLEVECCQDMGGFGYTISENCLCRRFGKPIGGKRAFYDLRDSAVRKHLSQVIDNLCSMGVRFIKNDYNQTTGIGFSKHSDSLATEYPECLDALISLFDEARKKYPDLKIENCGSGAMRCDNNVLRHFEIQSTSDQELFNRYASIASGSIGIMTPEKAGIWSFPYPCLAFEQVHAFNDEEFWQKKEERFKDGEETIFNMANGLLGSLYMSGRIDKCNDYNNELIKEGIQLYNSNKQFLSEALPIWPEGFFGITDRGIFSTGLINYNEDRILLTVWSIDSPYQTAAIDLSQYATSESTAEIIYPTNNKKCTCIFNTASKKLSVKMPDLKYSARIIEIKKVKKH